MLNLTAASRREVAPSASTACPGLFYGVSARDGMLARIRIPGGMVNYHQCYLLAEIADRYGQGWLQITNRGNVQIRGIRGEISLDDLQRLQIGGLGAELIELDALRNIMASPTAGIDPQTLMDTRIWVREIDDYLKSHQELDMLSPKFSIGLDGGERVTIRDRHNDILLVARQSLADQSRYLQVYLNNQDTQLCITPHQVLPVITACTQVYRQYCQENPTQNQRPHRLRQVLADWGMDGYLQKVTAYLGFSLIAVDKLNLAQGEYGQKTNNYDHIGIHNQLQPEHVYVGLILPLGKLTTKQIRGVTAIARLYGDETLRFTPWQNLIIPHIMRSQISEVLAKLEKLELDWHLENPWHSLIACSGTQGCASSHIDTQTQAENIAQTLPKLNYPLKIHISGCEKGCASQGVSDITIVGVAKDKYKIFIGKDSYQGKFGQELYTNLTPTEIPQVLTQIIQTYQTQHHDQESIQKFLSCYGIEQLRQLIGR